MDPVDLAEAIVEKINTEFSPGEIGYALEAEPALDPQVVLDHDEIKCFVIPDVVSYSFADQLGRRQIVGIGVTKFVSVVIATTFKSLHKGPDLANWNEAKKILKTRYLLDKFLLGLRFGNLQVNEVEASLPEEVELKYRNFVSVTSLGFTDQECVTQPEPLLSSLSSRRR